MPILYGCEASPSHMFTSTCHRTCKIQISWGYRWIRKCEKFHTERVLYKDRGKKGDNEEDAATDEGELKDDKSSVVQKNDRSSTSESEHGLQKQRVPEIYPQVMALPIARRPLFPGFYKAVMIRDPAVTAAVKDMMKRGQPYIGAFLFKDENADTDTISDLKQVHPIGVFAQITSVFPAANQGDEGALTAVLYPHRRIKITKLHNPQSSAHGMEPGSNGLSKTLASTSFGKDSDASFDQPSQDLLDGVDGKDSTFLAASDLARQARYATSFLRKYNVSLADVENLVEDAHDRKSPVIRAVTSEIVNVFKDIATLNPLFRDQISNFTMAQSAGNVFEEPAKLADFAAAVSAGEVNELQDVLETLSVEDRLQKALVVLKKELMNAQLQSKISRDVESKIQKRQREYYLMEQLRGIKRELGIESDGKDKLVDNFRLKAAKLAMPEAIKKVFDEEINKLAHLEPAASEFNVTRNYLDWLTQIPWGLKTPENYNIAHAIKVLDDDHHGLKDVKDRILEFIAVGKLKGSVEGKIICFVGPPGNFSYDHCLHEGVGKTSIGKSIARALNRQFYRFSVGGLTDVAEIKGHRRTYVGALPGRIIQALKKAQTENPLVLIDEVDKIGRGHQGDPSSALLELLDPEQNYSFLDHYMDVPVDLSKVLFVCTANITDTIPRPLLDRMEVIEISGYVADEKLAIAEKYLAPKAKDMSGLKNADISMAQDALELLIKSYCRESGVRNLKKQIDKVFRKSALNIVRQLGENVLPENSALTEEGRVALESGNSGEGGRLENGAGSVGTTEVPRKPLELPDTVHFRIDAGNLKDFVGPPIYTADRLYETTPPGVVMGLAWTSMGGAALYVESILENSLRDRSQPGLERTGQLGDVMRESSAIAYSFAKSFVSRQFPDNKFFEKAKIHLHCPEGAVPKDGPSAGVTMATSLLSLALDHSVDPTVAMTGELTLTGKILRIGGLREKAVAAKRSGATTIIFPRDNIADWEELPRNVKDGLKGMPTNWYADVYNIIFPNIKQAVANKMWLNEIKLPEDNRTMQM